MSCSGSFIENPVPVMMYKALTFSNFKLCESIWVLVRVGNETMLSQWINALQVTPSPIFLSWHYLVVLMFIIIIFHDSGGDSQQEGLAGYRLGNAYEEIGHAETAILVSCEPYANSMLKKKKECFSLATHIHI